MSTFLEIQLPDEVLEQARRGDVAARTRLCTALSRPVYTLIRRLVVGPESAGAVPGPACYRGGGPLTVTDCNVMLGKLIPDQFPRVFGPGGDQPIDRAVVERKFAELAESIRAETGQTLDEQVPAREDGGDQLGDEFALADDDAVEQ